MPGPAARREAVDVARAGALLAVVAGHLLLAVVDRAGGEVRGANLLALQPSWGLLAALSPMPVFFAAGGWAGVTTSLGSAVPRLRALIGLGAVVVCAWSAAVAVTALVAGDPGAVGDGARLATQPLWFLAAYVPLAAAAGPLGRRAATHGPVLVLAALVLLAVLDTLRFAVGAHPRIGWLGFLPAWGVAWVLGGWWRDRHGTPGFDERRAGLRLALVGGAACALLVTAAGYAPALIDAAPGQRSNTTPPTLYTAVAAITQVGALMALAPHLDRAGRRWRALWGRAGQVAVPVYCWHLTGLALCAAALALGVPTPERLTPGWWLTRPLWWGAVLGLTAALVLATRRARALRPAPVGGVPAPRALAGVLLAAVGGAALGLRGPRDVATAAVCSLLLVAAWSLLRPQGGAQRAGSSRPR